MEFITQNGQKTVEIKEASFQNASNLKKIAVKNLKNIGIDINNLNNVDGENLISKAVELLINLDSSDEFEKALFTCLENSLYDKFYKITPQLFDDKPEIREDYYEIASACVEVNLRPFFKSLVSALKQRFAKIQTKNTQE